MKPSRLASKIYEQTVAKNYLNWRNSSDKINETIILASQINDWDMPAFDGVIKDAFGRTIANLSIKGVRVDSLKDVQRISPIKVASTIKRVVTKAVRMIHVWSEESRWDSWMKYSRAELDLLILKDRNVTLLQRRQVLKTAIELFSIPLSQSGIRTRIVIAISDDTGQLRNVTEEQIPSQEISRILQKGGDLVGI